MKLSDRFSTSFFLKTGSLLFLFAIGDQTPINAQQNAVAPPVFQGNRIAQTTESAALSQTFTAYAVYQFEANALGKYAHKPDDEVRALVLRFGEEHEWNLLLEPVNMVMPGAMVTIASETGEQRNPLPLIRAFKGVIASSPNNSEVRLTVNDNFIYGFVREGDKSYFIEPLRYHVKGATTDQFVLYDAADVKLVAGNRCGSTEVAEKILNDQPEQSPCSGCRVSGIGVASDYSMFAKYGSVSEVLNHHIGVLNNVNSLYDNEFTCEIRFVFGKLYFSTCQGCDPWSSTTNFSDLLDSFQDWSNDGGFCSTVTSLSELWSDRDFDGSLGIVGLAYLPGLCILGQTAVKTVRSILFPRLVIYSADHYQEDWTFDGTAPPNPVYIHSNAFPIFFVENQYGHDCDNDFNNKGETFHVAQHGTFGFPYNQIAESVTAALPGWTLLIHRGAYPENITITKPLTLKADGGPVVIGN